MKIAPSGALTGQCLVLSTDKEARAQRLLHGLMPKGDGIGAAQTHGSPALPFTPIRSKNRFFGGLLHQHHLNKIEPALFLAARSNTRNKGSLKMNPDYSSDGNPSSPPSCQKTEGLR